MPAVLDVRGLQEQAAAMAVFVPGLQVCREYYLEQVRPVLDGLPHAAALLGRGSEVLGFDDETSTDHTWGPRVQLFLTDDGLAEPLALPEAVELHTVRGFFLEQLAVDLDGEIRARDWLTLPEHGLRALTAGEVFHDDVGLQAARDRLAHYPRDVWLYLMITGWWRVHPELNLAGRAGAVGDELGSALIGARLVSDLMRLCFLMERTYAPYSKWFGTAFARLACGPDLAPRLTGAVHAEDWRTREEAMIAAYEGVFALHNTLGITEPVATELVQMWDRPFKVAWADVPELLRAELRDPDVLEIAEQWPVGPVDQFRDLLWPARNRPALLRLFEPP